MKQASLSMFTVIIPTQVLQLSTAAHHQTTKSYLQRALKVTNLTRKISGTKSLWCLTNVTCLAIVHIISVLAIDVVREPVICVIVP